MSDLRGLFNDLIRFEIELWNAVDARLTNDFGLPLTHFEPMSVIDRIPGCRVHDIANELGITTGGTSKLIDRIEASGYCRRLPNPGDRRSSLLELTEAGRRMLAEAGTAFDDELQHRLGDALPERTLRQFASTLTRLRDASGRIGTQESGDEVVITDRGIPVARLLGPTATATLERLAADGIIGRGTTGPRPQASGQPRPRPRRPVADQISQQRR